MEERLIALQMVIPANDQSAIVAQPGEGPFHFPASAITTELATILRGGFAAPTAAGTNQLDAPMP
jgi:hypothetical protein